MTSSRFPIRFGKLSRVIFRGLLIRPHRCFVEVEDELVSVRMDWCFRARFARESIERSELGVQGVILGLGVHGWAGRWLVNGSLDGLVTLQLSPAQRARVLGVPVKLRELQLSLEDPDTLLARLRAA